MKYMSRLPLTDFDCSLGTAMISCCSRTCFKTFLWTWIVATTLVSIMDLVATGLFTWDVVESIVSLDGFHNAIKTPLYNYFILPHKDQTRFLEHFGIMLPDGVTLLDIPSYLLPVPSAILLAVSVRGIVFWIFNVVLIFVGRSLGKRIALDHYNSQFAQIVRPNLDDASDRNGQTPYINNNVETSYKEV